MVTTPYATLNATIKQVIAIMPGGHAIRLAPSASDVAPRTICQRWRGPAESPLPAATSSTPFKTAQAETSVASRSAGWPATIGPENTASVRPTATAVRAMSWTRSRRAPRPKTISPTPNAPSMRTNAANTISSSAATMPGRRTVSTSSRSAVTPKTSVRPPRTSIGHDTDHSRGTSPLPIAAIVLSRSAGTPSDQGLIPSRHRRPYRPRRDRQMPRLPCGCDRRRALRRKGERPGPPRARRLHRAGGDLPHDGVLPPMARGLRDLPRAHGADHQVRHPGGEGPAQAPGGSTPSDRSGEPARRSRRGARRGHHRSENELGRRPVRALVGRPRGPRRRLARRDPCELRRGRAPRALGRHRDQALLGVALDGAGVDLP